MECPIVTSVTAVKKYIIEVCFEDGTKGTYNLGHMANRGVFMEWDNEDHFFQVFVNPESHAITWPGELDIDTISVYCSIRKISVDEYVNPKLQHAAY